MGRCGNQETFVSSFSCMESEELLKLDVFFFFFLTSGMTRYLHKNYLACLPLQGQEVGNWIFLTLTLDFLTTDLLPRLARINFDSPLRKKSF